MATEIERFWAHVDHPSPVACWDWTGYRNKDGYGVIRVGSRTDGSRQLLTVHRFMAQMVLGYLPTDPNWTFDHLCRNRACVNPTHLELVRRGENALRGVGAPAMWARRTHCDHGHEFTPANISRRRSGGRVCKECERIRSRQRYAARKGA